MALTSVKMTEEVWLTCLSHALSTETEEIMGLLLGDTQQSKNGSVTALIWGALPQPRCDRRKDRVETNPEQLTAASVKAERMTLATGRTTRVIGWYHSHPHITVLPSHVDVRTQAMYQLLDAGFIGLIFSCFSEDAQKVGRIQVIAFQSLDGKQQNHMLLRPISLSPVHKNSVIDLESSLSSADTSRAGSKIEILEQDTGDSRAAALASKGGSRSTDLGNFFANVDNRVGENLYANSLSNAVQTMCMKPDVNITLHFDVVEDHQEHSQFMTLNSLFASRLMNFFRKHAQDCDIPEAILPDPFNQRCLTSNADLPLDVSSSHESKSLSSSHLCPSFSPRFSRQTAFAEAKIDQFSVPLSTCSPCESECTLNRELDSKRMSPELSKSSINLNNVKECQPKPGCSLVGNERTPQKILPESEIMLETPAQPTPKRSVPITEDKHKKMTDQESVVLNLTVKRSLDFSTLAGEEMSSDLISGSIEQHHDLNTEKKTMSKEDHVDADICPNEKKSCSFSKEEKIYQSHLTAVRQESFSLSDLVRLIHRIFQSVGCRSMTKVELLHKIIVHDFDVDENTDVEGQIELLERLVPDWLSKESAPTGDLLYSIKKASELNSVCERVVGV